eukprot:GILJ01006899.1.p1 GENE.GILJ01006899.1~~GILJ01006899.1.p1  ORF type:complete len:474 (+),score=43.45 GILJ01006899.1:112-1533(+)
MLKHADTEEDDVVSKRRRLDSLSIPHFATFFPEELLCLVFSYLSLADVSICSQVDKCWRTHGMSRQAVSSLVFREFGFFANKAIREFASGIVKYVFSDNWAQFYHILHQLSASYGTFDPADVPQVDTFGDHLDDSRRLNLKLPSHLMLSCVPVHLGFLYDFCDVDSSLLREPDVVVLFEAILASASRVLPVGLLRFLDLQQRRVVEFYAWQEGSPLRALTEDSKILQDVQALLAFRSHNLISEKYMSALTLAALKFPIDKKHVKVVRYAGARLPVGIISCLTITFARLWEVLELRIRNLLRNFEALDCVKPRLKDQIQLVIREMILRHTWLLHDRHLDQLMLCGVFSVTRQYQLNGRIAEFSQSLFTYLAKLYQRGPHVRLHICSTCLPCFAGVDPLQEATSTCENSKQNQDSDAHTSRKTHCERDKAMILKLLLQVPMPDNAPTSSIIEFYNRIFMPLLRVGVANLVQSADD